MQTVSHHSLDELKRLRHRALGGMRDRLQMVILAMQGQTAPQIAQAVGSSRRTVQDWVYSYNASGLEGLKDRRGGNRRHLTRDQERRLCEYLDRTAADPHQGVRRGEDLRQWIQQQFGVMYSLPGIYDWLYVIGAACPATGQTVGMISLHIDTTITNVFLEEMSRQIPPDVHVVLIWDQAGVHTATHLKVPSNITLLPLPPYSPELNPTENLWHYLRSHHWSNREYPDWDALDDAACDAWKKTCLDRELVKSICRASYIEPREVRA